MTRDTCRIPGYLEAFEGSPQKDLILELAFTFGG